MNKIHIWHSCLPKKGILDEFMEIANNKIISRGLLAKKPADKFFFSKTRSQRRKKSGKSFRQLRHIRNSFDVNGSHAIESEISADWMKLHVTARNRICHWFSYLVHRVTIRESADVLQLCTGRQLVAYLIHDKVCKVLHPLWSAAHANKLKRKGTNVIAQALFAPLHNSLWHRQTFLRGHGCHFRARDGRECLDPSARYSDFVTWRCHRCI